MAEKENQSTQTGKKRTRQERDWKTTPCPSRSPVKVFRKFAQPLKGEEKGSFYRDQTAARGNPVKSQCWQEVDNKRQESRNGFRKSMMNDMRKIKNVTNDDLLVVFKRSEKNEGDIDILTTSLDFVTIPDSTEVLNTSQDVSVPPPAVLSGFSPSRGVGRAKPTGRKQKRNCKVCGGVYKAEDDNYKPWVGCQSFKDGGSAGENVRCSYWVHACCIGWFPQNNMEVAAMPSWYCKRHRKRVIEDMEAKRPKNTASKSRTVSKKSKKK